MASHGNTRKGKTKYPASFYNYSNLLDLTKVSKPILHIWITNEITSLLGFEDEIVTNTVINLFGLATADGTSTTDSNNISTQQLNEMIDPRQAHVVLSGFFNEDIALQFCIKLWDYMIDASQQPTGIPREIIEAKKRQLQQEKLQQSNVTTVAASQPQRQPEERISSINIQNQPRKRRNRWDNNNDVAAIDIHQNYEQPQQPNVGRNIEQPDILPSRDEYGRSRKQDRRHSRYDSNELKREKGIKHSSDRHRHYDDEVRVEDYHGHYDNKGYHNHRRTHHDHSSSDRQHRDRHDDDYYNDKHYKRNRHY